MPRRTLVAATLAAATGVASLIGGAARAHAQAPAPPLELEAPRARQGYYHALGVYFYDAQQWDHGRPDGVTPGALVSIRLGQMLTRRWGLGLRLEMGGGRAGGRSSATSGLGLEAELNPIRDLALHAGVGLGSGTVTNPKDLEQPTRGGYASVYMLGVSWDIFLTRRLTGGWALAPTVMVRYVPSDSHSGLWVCGGVQISHWFGRPRKELILPDTDAFK